MVGSILTGYLVIAMLFDVLFKRDLKKSKRYKATPGFLESLGRALVSLLWLPVLLYILWTKAFGKR